MPLKRTVNDEISLLDLHDGIIRLENVFMTHTGAEESQIQLIMIELLAIKKQIVDVQSKNEERLRLCHAEVELMLSANHFTKMESRKEITKAIIAHDGRLKNQLKIFLMGIGFVGFLIGIGNQYGPIILAILAGKGD